AVGILREDQEVAAADAVLLDAEALLQQAFAFHHRHAPVTLAADDLADLKLVAEHPQRPAGRHTFGRIRQPVEAVGRRAGKHSLADTLDEPFSEAVNVGREDQNTHAKTSIKRLFEQQHPFDRRFALAYNDKRHKPSKLERGLAYPPRTFRSHDN